MTRKPQFNEVLGQQKTNKDAEWCKIRFCNCNGTWTTCELRAKNITIRMYKPFKGCEILSYKFITVMEGVMMFLAPSQLSASSKRIEQPFSRTHESPNHGTASSASHESTQITQASACQDHLYVGHIAINHSTACSKSGFRRYTQALQRSPDAKAHVRKPLQEQNRSLTSQKVIVEEKMTYLEPWDRVSSMDATIASGAKI